MKAKEFRKYMNYAFYVFIEDMDEEFINNGESIVDSKTDCCTSYRRSTKAEIERFWNKEVISIKPASSGIMWPEGGGPSAIRLHVSSLTEEERKERAHQKEVDEVKKRLEFLTDRKVTIGAKIKHPKKNVSLVGSSTIGRVGDTIVTIKGGK